MRYTCIVVSLFLLTEMAAAQTDEQSKDTDRILCEYGGAVLISKLGTTRIFFKDNTQKKHCTIVEMKEYWVVYKKDGSLHDAMIDKIKRIELEDETHAIYFDSKNKPVMRKITNSTY